MHPTDLTAIEKVVQEFADPIAKEYRLKSHQFRISLISENQFDVRVVSGPGCVQIILPWPYSQPKMKSRLKKAFSYIRDMKLLHSMEVVPADYNENLRAWKYQQLGEIAEILPQKRIEYRKHYSITAVDKKTGITVTVEDKNDQRQGFDIKEQARFELSRKVREFEAWSEKFVARKPAMIYEECPRQFSLVRLEETPQAARYEFETIVSLELLTNDLG